MPQSTGVCHGSPDSPLNLAGWYPKTLSTQSFNPKDGSPKLPFDPLKTGGGCMDDAFIWSANERHMQAMRRHPTLRNNLPHKGVDIYPNLPLKTEIVDNQSGGTASEVAGRKAPSQLLHSTYSYGRCSSRHGPPQNRGRTHTIRRARFVFHQHDGSP